LLRLFFYKIFYFLEQNNIDNKNTTSLNKAISQTGFCSRREADAIVEKGWVTINDVQAKSGNRVTPNDIIKIKGEVLAQKKEKPIFIAFNKPLGIECTTNAKVKENIVDYLKFKERIFPIGRLDKNSEGLIFLTNNGDIVNEILRSRNNHEKEYIVKVNKTVTGKFIRDMSNGVLVLNTITKKCKVTKISNNTFNIILTQGLNRQIRRMCKHFGYKVVSLKRIRIMNVNLGSLPLGKWRNLTNTEWEVLKASLVQIE